MQSFGKKDEKMSQMLAHSCDPLSWLGAARRCDHQNGECVEAPIARTHRIERVIEHNTSRSKTHTMSSMLAQDSSSIFFP